MATQSKAWTAEKAAAREAGFSLNWLEQLEDHLPSATEVAAENYEDRPERSANLTGRIHGAIPRPRQRKPEYAILERISIHVQQNLSKSAKRPQPCSNRGIPQKHVVFNFRLVEALAPFRCRNARGGCDIHQK